MVRRLHALKLKAKDVETLTQGLTPPYQDVSEPHSERAMSTLKELFETADETLCLATEVTSPTVFEDALRQRADTGKKTWFLMPKRSGVVDARKGHHDEMLRDWITLVKESATLRRNVRIFVTKEPFRDLYTSAYARGSVRFDVWRYSSGTTRQGRVLQVENGVSLYDTVGERYKAALSGARPLYRIWPFRAFWRSAGSYILFLIVAGCLAAISLLFWGLESSIASFLSVMASGLLVNLVSTRARLEDWWKSPTPFKNP